MNINPRTLARVLGGELAGGNILAPGPGHDPRDRSLSIKLDDNAPEGFIVYSFAGDDPIDCRDYVRSKVGLSASRPQCQSDNDTICRTTGHKVRPHPVAEYVYYDDNDQPSRKVVRMPDKKFRQYRWTGSGWQSGVKGVPTYPYRLQDMLKAFHDTVFIAEGEKDADRLAAYGYVSTTNPGGAGSWNPELNRWFAGKKIYIMEDNDDAGRKRCQRIARELYPFAESVRIVTFRNLPEKADVSDWLDTNSDKNHLLIQEFEKFSLWTPEVAEVSHEDIKSPSLIRANVLQSMAFPSVKYVVPGYIVEGLTLFAGKPKIGKSWLALDIAVAVARGGLVLGDIKCAEGDVLYAALEDTPRRLHSRMNKIVEHQTWPKRLEFETNMQRLDQGGIDYLRDWTTRRPAARLIIVDTLQKVRAIKKFKEDPYAADYAASASLKALSDETGIAIVLIHHVRKMDADDPIDTVSGTTGLTAAADSILVLNRNSQGVTLYGRGRDIEEIEVAVQFDRSTCRWTELGKASDVRRSSERAEILSALIEASEPMNPRDLSISCGMSRNNTDQLLFKMAKDGEVLKVGRGLYVHPERSELTSSPFSILDKNNKK